MPACCGIWRAAPAPRMAMWSKRQQEIAIGKPILGMAGKEEPHQENGQGEGHQQLGPGGGGNAEDTGVGDATAYEELEGDQVESEAIHGGGGGHGEEANGSEHREEGDQGPDALGGGGKAEPSTKEKEGEGGEKAEHHPDEGPLGVVLRVQVAALVILEIRRQDGGIEAKACTGEEGEAKELGEAQGRGKGGGRKNQQHQHRAVKGGGEGDPAEKAQELVALEGKEGKHLKADGHALAGIAHGHHGDEVGEGEGEGKPGPRLGAAEVQQADGENQATECIHQVNIPAPVGADPVEQAVARFILQEHVGQGDAARTLQIGEVVEPVAAHLVAQANQQGEEEQQGKEGRPGQTTGTAQPSPSQHSPGQEIGDHRAKEAWLCRIKLP
jgi:hypothetical protein